MLKIVLDTNIIISAIAFGGKPHIILENVIKGKLTLHISLLIMDEVENILRGRKFQYNEEMLYIIKSELEEISEIIYPKKKINLIKDDPDDNKKLECASESKADYIISGGKHLLNLRKYKKIKILNPSGFLDIFHNKI